MNEQEQFAEKTSEMWMVKLGIVAAHYYCIAVIAWVVLHVVTGDRWWWMFLLNTFSEYLFIPLPLALALALLVRRRDLIVGSVAICVVGALMHGHLLLPPLHLKRTAEPHITVMTSNILGFNMATEAVVEAIRASDADIVALQELNPQIAEAIQRELSERYPYQALAPEVGVMGVGAISRYPMELMDVDIEGAWVGGPQVLNVTWEGENIVIINIHAVPPGAPTKENLSYTIEEREQQLSTLVAFVEAQEDPVIVLGDLNAGEKNTAHKIMREALRDAWVKGGWGLGHTFPGAASEGSSRVSIGDVLMPKWLLRLDYIFYSEAWEVEEARIGPWDGTSDHRPVVAELGMRE